MNQSVVTTCCLWPVDPPHWNPEGLQARLPEGSPLTRSLRSPCSRSRWRHYKTPLKRVLLRLARGSGKVAWWPSQQRLVSGHCNSIIMACAHQLVSLLLIVS